MTTVMATSKDVSVVRGASAGTEGLRGVPEGRPREGRGGLGLVAPAVQGAGGAALAAGPRLVRPAAGGFGVVCAWRGQQNQIRCWQIDQDSKPQAMKALEYSL